VTQVSIAQEDVWAPEAVMIFWRREVTTARIRTDTTSQHIRARNVVALPNTLPRI